MVFGSYLLEIIYARLFQVDRYLHIFLFQYQLAG